MKSFKTVIEGFIEPNLEKTYVHVPFQVPENAVRLNVTFHYNDRIGSHPLLIGGNTIDLGLFDERGTEFINAGFRGWSGSERDQFFLTETETTPGYLAGPINPGEWNLLFGLYKLAAGGCKYSVEVTIEVVERRMVSKRIEEENLPALPASSPAAPFFPWLRGELHCHTHHSDGKLKITELIERARMRGMDFLAVTDHNTTAAQRDLEVFNDPGLILIRGVEATTFKGHFNIWGIPNWIDFRVQSEDDMRGIIQYANDLGGVTSCGHPKPYGPDWDYHNVTNFHCVEVWNGPWSGLNEISLAFWVSLLREGKRKPMLGGSDFHQTSENGGRDIGTPTNWVYLPGDLNERSLLHAVRMGHVSVSAEPDGPFIELRGGDDLSFMGGDLIEWSYNNLPIEVRSRGADGNILQIFNQNQKLSEKEITDSTEIIYFDQPVLNSMFVRAELRNPDGLLRALTNPIYLHHVYR